MLKTRFLVGSLAVVLAFELLGAACGGDDGGPLQAQAPSDDPVASDAASSQDASSDTTGVDHSDASDSDASSPVAKGGSSTPPQLAQGAWEGSVHFEVSGDVDLSADMPGGGVTQGEFSLLTFAADDGSGASQIAFTAGSENEAAIFVSSNGFTGGGAIGKECSLSTQTNEEKKVEGTFSCKGAKGVRAASLDDLVVDIQGTFQVSRP
jgi:hypothetical protein